MVVSGVSISSLLNGNLANELDSKRSATSLPKSQLLVVTDEENLRLWAGEEVLLPLGCEEVTGRSVGVGVAVGDGDGDDTAADDDDDDDRDGD